MGFYRVSFTYLMCSASRGLETVVSELKDYEETRRPTKGKEGKSNI
jgi:hypothetical protein